MCSAVYLRHALTDPLFVLSRGLEVLHRLVGDVPVGLGAHFLAREDQVPLAFTDFTESIDVGHVRLAHSAQDLHKLIRSQRELPVLCSFSAWHGGICDLTYFGTKQRDGASTHGPYIILSVYPSMVKIPADAASRPRPDRRTPEDIAALLAASGVTSSWPMDTTIRDALIDWFGIIDQIGTASSGLAAIDISEMIGWGHFYGHNTNLSTSFAMEVEYLDWLNAGDGRHRRVRAPTWATYLSREHTERVDPDRTMVQRYNAIEGDVANTHLAQTLPGGGSVYFACADPMEFVHDTIISVRDRGTGIATAWLWQRLREANML